MWERTFLYLEVFGQNKKSVVAHVDRLQWWQMEGMQGNWNRTQAEWEQSFFCLCVSEGQDEGCQWKNSCKSIHSLHSIILSQKKYKQSKSLDTIVCEGEGSSESISLKRRVYVIPIDGPAATLCNWLQLSPWLCEMRLMGRISLTLLTRQLQLKSFRDEVKTNSVVVVVVVVI